MDILSYLFELLQQRKEVGITGLGTFYKKKFPGRYDKEKQAFLPPGYSLQFNTEIKEEDALVDYISSKRNLSIESAQYYVAQFVAEISKKLELEHEADLENLGRLFFTEHEGLSFEPAKKINYGSKFFGLPSLPETIAPENPTVISSKDNEELYEEIAEAPTRPISLPIIEEEPSQQPEVENIELDEVKDDLRNTLKHVDHLKEEKTDVPEFIKEQHAEHPKRFGHTPEDEEAVRTITESELQVPESIIEQHQENPERFGHTPESEVQKTYVNLEDEPIKDEAIIEAPEFIKEQHAEHPNRFGHDPLLDMPLAEETKSPWLKIVFGMIGVIVLIVGIIYLAKPELFNTTQKVEDPQVVPALIDSTQKIDTAKLRQDSIAKTDSILKANQVKPKAIDSVKRPEPVVKPIQVKPKVETAAQQPEIISFDIIAAAYKTEAGAEKYIAIMKKNGLSAKIANMTGPWKKVSIASFKTQKEAEEQKEILQKKLKGKGFYVQQIIKNTQP